MTLLAQGLFATLVAALAGSVGFAVPALVNRNIQEAALVVQFNITRLLVDLIADAKSRIEPDRRSLADRSLADTLTSVVGGLADVAAGKDLPATLQEGLEDVQDGLQRAVEGAIGGINRGNLSLGTNTLTVGVAGSTFPYPFPPLFAISWGIGLGLLALLVVWGGYTMRLTSRARETPAEARGLRVCGALGIGYSVALFIIFPFVLLQLPAWLARQLLPPWIQDVQGSELWLVNGAFGCALLVPLVCAILQWTL